ncbi:protein of unknown function [Streptantibioticus cattleyicolor NRRL 8057 = DSM 46488]|nr:protein of unknown function [Streptantibioticus cattleyicolor NRRL 8057 = DSM 46488]
MELAPHAVAVRASAAVAMPAAVSVVTRRTRGTPSIHLAPRPALVLRQLNARRCQVKGGCEPVTDSKAGPLALAVSGFAGAGRQPLPPRGAPVSASSWLTSSVSPPPPTRGCVRTVRGAHCLPGFPGALRGEGSLALAVSHYLPGVPPVPLSSWLTSRMFPPAHPWLCSHSAGRALSALGPGALRGDSSLRVSATVALRLLGRCGDTPARPRSASFRAAARRG